jgi:hypothetical protein
VLSGQFIKGLLETSNPENPVNPVWFVNLLLVDRRVSCSIDVLHADGAGIHLSYSC